MRFHYTSTQSFVDIFSGMFEMALWVHISTFIFIVMWGASLAGTDLKWRIIKWFPR